MFKILRSFRSGSEDEVLSEDGDGDEV